MTCAQHRCKREATHEVRRKPTPHGFDSPTPHASEFFCDTHALETWRLAGYRSRVIPLYAFAGGV